MNHTAYIVTLAEEGDYKDLKEKSPNLPDHLVRALEFDVLRERRYFLSDKQHKALQWLKQKVKTYELDSTVLYRAQVGVLSTVGTKDSTKFLGQSKKEVQTADESISGRQPLSAERMKPHHAFITAGRANSKRIPALYCADEIETALLEVRAPVGSAVTIAEFTNSESLKLADLRVPDTLSDWNNFEEFKSRFTEAIASVFAKRLVGDEAYERYIFTQQIAEYLKYSNFDGIIYSSSQGSGNNYVFFNIDDLDISERAMYQIDSTKISFSLLERTEIIKA